MSDKIFNQVRKVVAEHLSIDEERITLETSFRDDLNADSLDLVEMIMALEELFDLEIDEESAEKIATVGDAVAYLKRLSS